MTTRPLRILLRTTFEVVDIEVEEAESAEEAQEKVAARAPDVVVLDVGMPGMGGLTFCRQLKDDPATADVGVVLLTGSEGTTEEEASAAGADALLRKPFSPLELLNCVERIAGGLYEGPFREEEGPPEEQLILYAQDLRRLLEVERGQRAIIQRAYQETVTALASALESKDTGTGEHSAARAAVRDRAREIHRPGAPRRREHRVRVPAPRRREDRDPGPDPPEAGLARAVGAAAPRRRTRCSASSC